MKTFLILSLFLLVVPWQARAQLLPFNYTGNTLEAINGPGSWYESGATYTGGPSWTTALGGPGGQDLYGAAEQFTLSQPTNISSLVYSIYTQDDGTDSTRTYIYNIYSGSRINGNGSMALLESMGESDLVSFTTPYDPNNYSGYRTITGEVPFDVNLPAGTYWLAEQGGGGDSLYTTSQGYIDPSPIAAVPEPETWLLLTCALVLFAFNQTKLKLV